MHKMFCLEFQIPVFPPPPLPRRAFSKLPRGPWTPDQRPQPANWGTAAGLCLQILPFTEQSAIFSRFLPRTMAGPTTAGAVQLYAEMY